jgi:hypothetical protein
LIQSIDLLFRFFMPGKPDAAGLLKRGRFI